MSSINLRIDTHLCTLRDTPAACFYTCNILCTTWKSFRYPPQHLCVDRPRRSSLNKRELASPVARYCGRSNKTWRMRRFYVFHYPAAKHVYRLEALGKSVGTQPSVVATDRALRLQHIRLPSSEACCRISSIFHVFAILAFQIFLLKCVGTVQHDG